MQSEQSDEPAAPPRPRKRLRKGCEMIADDHDGCVICSEPICRPATLEGCGHTDFCLACILQWSETTNTCPICRARFGWVCDKSDASCRIPVEDTEPAPAQVEDAEEESEVKKKAPTPVFFPIRGDPISPICQRLNSFFEEEEPWSCEVCALNDQPDRVLICDGCERLWHLHCLDPPLETVPRGDWYCASCATSANRPSASSRMRARSTRSGGRHPPTPPTPTPHTHPHPTLPLPHTDFHIPTLPLAQPLQAGRCGATQSAARGQALPQ